MKPLQILKPLISAETVYYDPQSIYTVETDPLSKRKRYK